MKRWNLFFLLLIYYSCKEPQRSKGDTIVKDSSKILSQPVKDTISDALYDSKLSPDRQVPANKIFTDTVTFAERNDNGDYFLFYVRKGNQLVSLVYENLTEQQLGFLRGDTLQIQWKMDSIWIVGDDDRPEVKEWLISVKKIKDSKVAIFRKNYTKPLKYWHAQDVDYSNDFKDYLYRLVEYYLSYSKQELVKVHLQKPEETDFVYSIEEMDKNGRHYTVLGLSNDRGTHSTIIQWLYLDSETHTLYEYNLANDKLIPFT